MGMNPPSVLPAKPPGPDFATTRWQGSTSGTGFLRQALPTARAPLPMLAASWP